MPTVRLTRKSVAALALPEQPTVYWDADLAGFGLAVRPTGAKSWVVKYRSGSGRRAPQRRIVLDRLKEVDRGGGLTVEEARKKAQAILAEARLGGDPANARREAREAPTLRELGERYQAETAAGRKESSKALYAIYWNRHILPALGSKKARDITRADVAKLHVAIAAGGHRVTANRVLVHLRSFYNWAADDTASCLPKGFVNPTGKVERFQEFAKERYLTAEELGQLGDALRQAETVGIPWPEADESKPKAKHAPKRPEVRRTMIAPAAAAAIRLLLFTGARLREILHLQWSEVDLERGLLHLGNSKTGRKTIVLAAPAMELLATLPRQGRYVISSESAGQKDEKPRADLHRPWKLVCRAAGLEGVRIHDLRHSFASVGAAGNLGLPVIGSLLGHRSPDITQRYAHLADSPLRAAADRIAETIAARLDGTAPPQY